MSGRFPVIARNPALVYQGQAVHTADGPHLLIMICERIAADLARAETAIEQVDYATCDENLQHAQRSVRLLRVALEPDGFPGGRELESVYAFIEQHLVRANLEKSVVLVRECADLFHPIHEAWRRAVTVTEQSGDATHVG